MPTTSRHGLLLGTTRLAWATALVVAPRSLLHRIGARADTDTVRVARLLGGRHAVQAVVELWSWPRWRRLGAGVDGLHAATALGLAGVDTSRRRVALCDALVAAGLAAAGLAR